MKTAYPEIKALQQLYEQHSIHISIEEGSFLGAKSYYPKVICKINSCSFELYVDDEFNDLSLNNPLLHLYLILRELEYYQEEKDILKWANGKGLNPGDSDILSYYKGLSDICNQVALQLGTLDSHISDLDFQLNAGAAQMLRAT